jgi:nucleoside-triphosphatase THEP1
MAINQKLAEVVISEVDLLETLNLELKHLSVLRLQKGLPYVRLNSRNRVYLLSEIVVWLQQNARTISEK